MTVTDTEIREWARSEGIDAPPRGPVPAALRSEYATAMAEKGVFTAPFEEVPPPPAPRPFRAAEKEGGRDAGPGTDGQRPGPARPPGPPAGERPPSPPPRKGAGARIRESLRPGPAAAPRPRAFRARVPVDGIIGFVWGGLASVSARLGERYAPLTKALAFEAPVAGAVIDEAVKGTPADVPLQMIARWAQTGGEAGVIIGLPAVAAYTCYNPAAYPVTRPVMVQLVKQHIILAGPHIRRMRERERKFAEQLAEFGGEEFAASAEGIVDELFGPAVIPDQMQEAMARATADGQAPGPGPAAGDGFSFFGPPAAEEHGGAVVG